MTQSTSHSGLHALKRLGLQFFVLMTIWFISTPIALAQGHELRDARVSVFVEGGPVQSAAVTLPYHWDRVHKGKAGRAEFELRFPATKDELIEPWGIYFPRIGNVADVWLNGTLVASLGDLQFPNDADFSKGPQYVTVPPLLLKDDNTLRIVLRADGSRRGGLAPPVVGPQDAVRPLYKSNYWARVGASVVIAVLSLLVGVMALSLWVTQRDWEHDGRRDGVYLAAAVAEFCWALRVGDVIIEHPPLPWPAWGVVVTVAFAGWICGIGWFCHRVAGWHKHHLSKWFQSALWLLLGSSIALSTASFQLQEPIWLTLWLGIANLAFSTYAVIYLWHALRQRENKLRLLVGFIGAVNVVVGVRDWFAIRLAGGLEVNTWLRYSSVLFGVALAIIVLVRFRTDSARARDLAANLVRRIYEKEQELASSYSRMEKLAREQASASERAKILRDMHDGVGMHLSTAIRLLRSESADKAELLRTLTDSLDQLKLSIDALQVGAGDVGVLLAAMRYRLEPRLVAAGLELEWRSDDLPPVAWLDSQSTRHLQFLLFESISNALQHAEATVLTVAAQHRNRQIQIDISDNGKGFDATNGQRLKTIRARASAIPIALDVQSGPEGTRISLNIPLDPVLGDHETAL